MKGTRVAQLFFVNHSPVITGRCLSTIPDAIPPADATGDSPFALMEVPFPSEIIPMIVCYPFAEGTRARWRFATIEAEIGCWPRHAKIHDPAALWMRLLIRESKKILGVFLDNQDFTYAELLNCWMNSPAIFDKKLDMPNQSLKWEIAVENILIVTNWEAWKWRGLKSKERIEMMRQNGINMTVAKLEKRAERLGLF